MPAIKHPEYDYALLRMKKEKMPSWSCVLGLHAMVFNGEAAERMYPRLGFKKKLGSYFANPYSDKKEEQEARYIARLKEMLE